MSASDPFPLPSLKRFEEFGVVNRLRTNAPLEGDDTHQIEELQAAHRDDKARVQTEVTRLQAEARRLEREAARVRGRMHELKSQQELLDSYLSVSQTLLSPIRKLPSEILSRVFN